MEQITLTKRDGTQVNLMSKEPFRTVKAATQSKSMMGVDTVTLSIVSREVMDFEKGDMIQVNGESYYIRTKVNREITSGGYFKYDAVFYGVLYDLMKTPYRNMDANGNSTTSTFDLVYTLKELIRVLIYNVRHDYPGLWVFDETGCPDKDPLAFQFSCNNCLEVLQQVCQKFSSDFRITQANGVRTIQVGRFGSNVTPPDGSSYFEWGRGKGLYSLNENKVDDKSIKTRLWVEGGTTNLPTGYRDYAMRLQLPLRRKNKNSHTLSDGTVIEADSEYIGITSENARYIEDTALSDLLGVDADSKLYEEIVPTRTGTVTAIANDDVYSFFDSGMDFDINDHLVNGVSAKVTFTTGKLAGQTLEIHEYDATTKMFTLVPYQDSRGLVIPTEDSTAFRIAYGDKYKLTDIIMPQAIIDDAEEDLWYAGYDDLSKLKQSRVQYSLELNRMRILEAMPDDSDTVLFNPGDYVPVKDTRFGVQKNIRIQRVDRNLLIRHDYKLTISDTAKIDVITQAVIDTQSHENIIIANNLKDPVKARRGWRTTEDLKNMVFDTDGYFDKNNFKANTIEANMLAIGSKSQQFILEGVIIRANYQGNPDRINITAGTLVHLTVDDTRFVTWNMSASDTTLTNTSGYYLYAKCSKSTNTGVWYITQEKIKFEPDNDTANYYFQVGIIASRHSDDSFRDFATTYGFTRINGNTITTGRIVSAAGSCVFDLDNNSIVGAITITTGSGYNNLTDKPDLSVYATTSSLAVEHDRITAAVSSIGTVSSDLDAVTTRVTALEVADGTISAKVTEVEGIAITASDNADTAISTANTANSTANTANSTANTANSTANTASSTASTASSTASSALSTANTANSTANSASSTASSALSTANTANTNASNAYNMASSAITRVGQVEITASGISASVSELRSGLSVPDLLSSPLNWEQGSTSETYGYSYNSIKTYSTSRIRTKDLIPVESGSLVLRYNSGYQVGISLFNSSKQCLDDWSGFYGGTGHEFSVSSSAAYMAILVKSGSDIAPSEISDVGLTIVNNGCPTYSELRTVGINMSASDWSINLRGDKVNFCDSSGNPSSLKFNTSNNQYEIGGFLISNYGLISSDVQIYTEGEIAIQQSQSVSYALYVSGNVEFMGDFRTRNGDLKIQSKYGDALVTNSSGGLEVGRTAGALELYGSSFRLHGAISGTIYKDSQGYLKVQ